MDFSERNIRIESAIDLKNMTQRASKTYLIWVLKGNLVVWAINGILFAVMGLLGYDWATLVAAGFFSKVTFLETGASFLIGGALAFSGSVLQSKAKEQILKTADEPWSMEKLRKGEKRANKFIVLAIILFVESLFVAFLGL